MSTGFRSRFIALLAVGLTAALFVHLGLWQRDRAQMSAAAVALYQERARLPPLVVDERRVDATRIDAAPVVVRGRYEPQWQFFLDNRQNDGMPGVEVVTPLKIEPGETRVLVDRGWIGWSHGRGTLPEVPAPGGIVMVRGVARLPSSKKPFLMPEVVDDADRLWPRLDLARFERWVGHSAQPVVVLQDQNDAADGLVRHWPPPPDKTMMHRGYEYQWFGMAAALVLFYGFTVARGSRQAPA